MKSSPGAEEDLTDSILRARLARSSMTFASASAASASVAVSTVVECRRAIRPGIPAPTVVKLVARWLISGGRIIVIAGGMRLNARGPISRLSWLAVTL